MLKLNQDIQNIISEISETASYLWVKGWAEKNAGNFSVNITEFIDENIKSNKFLNLQKQENLYSDLNNNYLLVSAANSRMRDIAKDPLKYLLLVKVDKSSYSYLHLGDFQQFGPTSELPTHLLIQNLMANKGGNNKAILHTHPNELIAMTHNKNFKTSEDLSLLIWNMHPEAMIFLPDGVGVVPYTLTGSSELAIKTKEYFEKYKLVIWEKHGCLAIGKSILDAFDLIDTASKSIDIYFKCKNAGFDPEGLTEEQLMELKCKFGN